MQNFFAPIMKTVDLKAFRKQINLTQDELGEYLGCKKAFISAIENGTRPIPDEMYSKLINNPHGWDVSMLLIHDKKENTILQAELDRYRKENEELRAQVEYHKMVTAFYEDKQKAQEAVLKQREEEYYQMREEVTLLKFRIEMLIKGGLREFVTDAGDSSSASAV